MKIEKIIVDEIGLPLSEPYRLAHGTVHKYDLFLVRVETSTGTGLGEVVPLDGYGLETVASIRSVLDVAAELPGLDLEVARSRIRRLLAGHPFAASALLDALDVELTASAGGVVPLAGIVSGVLPAEAAECSIGLLQQGYRTLKMKVGMRDDDLARVREVLRVIGREVILRLDANEAWSYREAVAFMDGLDGGEGIEYLEQPLPRNDWEDLSRLARRYSGKVMLDESIWTDDDLFRAVSLKGCRRIKLKAVKTSGMAELIRLGRLARSSGFEVIVGNGVAADISCWREALAWGRLYPAGDGPAGEMNGYLKTSTRLLLNPLLCRGGCLVYPAGYRPILDKDMCHRFLNSRRIFS